jgi:hypothetical protein
VNISEILFWKQSYTAWKSGNTPQHIWAIITKENNYSITWICTQSKKYLNFFFSKTLNWPKSFILQNYNRHILSNFFILILQWKILIIERGKNKIKTSSFPFRVKSDNQYQFVCRHISQRVFFFWQIEEKNN